MLVYLHRYERGEAQGNRQRDEGDTVERTTEDYFGTDDLEADEWEQFDYHGTSIRRKVVEFDDVTAVSVPKDHLDEQEEVPGITIQLRMDGGEVEYVENARVIEVMDNDP
jgi:hypothetical protein